MLIWITGLAGAGKTAIATALYKRLKGKYTNLVLLDGDDFREVMGQDVGYDLDSRKIMARRMSRLCRYLTNQGIHVICATISMHKEIHEFNRSAVKDYYEILVDVSMENLVAQDKKQLYSRALKHEIYDVVGVDLPFDKPVHSDLVIDNNVHDALDAKVQKILDIIGEDDL